MVSFCKGTSGKREQIGRQTWQQHNICSDHLYCTKWNANCVTSIMTNISIISMNKLPNFVGIAASSAVPMPICDIWLVLNKSSDDGIFAMNLPKNFECLCSRSVSYTHLDVYKRQTVHSAWWMFAAERFSTIRNLITTCTLHLAVFSIAALILKGYNVWKTHIIW